MGRLSWLKDARRLSISLTIVAAILYSYSLTQARFEIGHFGSIHSLPLSFFVSLSLLTIGSAILWVSPQPHGKLLGLQLGLFIIALHLTMLAIGGIGASQSNAIALYSEFGLSEYIFRTGHFSPTPPELWRLNWPAAIMLNTAIMSVLGIDDANLVLTLNIFLWILLTTPLVYLFLRSTIGKDRMNHCLAGTWLFFLANWLLFYLLPSIVGYLLLLTIISLLAKSILQKQQGISSAYAVCLILILLVLPATHLLNALVALTMLLALYAIMRAKVSGLALILAVIIAAWSIYVTVAFFEGMLPLFVEQVKSAFRVDIIWELGVSERMMVGSEARQAVTKLRVLFAAVFSVIGFAGGIMMLKDRKITSSDKFVLATVIGMLTMLLIISEAYEWELIQRAYFFVIPAIAYFGVKLLKHKITAIILTILLVVALPLNFITFYGNAIGDFASPAAIRGAYFFHEHTNQGFVTGALIYFPLGFMENRENYQWVWLGQIRLVNNVLKQPFGYPNHTYQYVYLRPEDRAIYEFIGSGELEQVNEETKAMLDELIRSIDDALNANLVYVNRAISIYAVRNVVYQVYLSRCR